MSAAHAVEITRKEFEGREFYEARCQVDGCTWSDAFEDVPHAEIPAGVHLFRAHAAHAVPLPSREIAPGVRRVIAGEFARCVWCGWYAHVEGRCTGDHADWPEAS